MCPCDTWTTENVTHGKMNNRVKGSFLSHKGNQTIQWGREKEKKRKKGKKMRKKKRRGGNLCVEEKKKKASIPGVPKVGSH